jgi:hypothetical protein
MLGASTKISAADVPLPKLAAITCSQVGANDISGINVTNAIFSGASKIETILSVLLDSSQSVVSRDEVKIYLEDCVKEFTKGNQIAFAREHTKSFVVPEKAIRRDFGDLQRLGSIELLASERQTLSAADRFNIDRFNEVFAFCPPEDLTRLQRIAVEGSWVPLTEGFIRKPHPEPVR